MDSNCLGVECCLTVPILSASVSLKAYARIDPCKLQFITGINRFWNYTVDLLPPELQGDFGKFKQKFQLAVVASSKIILLKKSV